MKQFFYIMPFISVVCGTALAQEPLRFECKDAVANREFNVELDVQSLRMTIVVEGTKAMIDGYATHLRGLGTLSKDDRYQLRNFDLAIHENGSVELMTVGECRYLR